MKLIFRTANEAMLRLSALITANAPNIADLRNDEWHVISPFGEFPSPDRSYTQIFSREQADRIVATWNSIAGKAARLFKNMAHGLGAKFSSPVFDGHPETNKQLWPKDRLLAETTDLRVTDNGLEGKLTWNEKGMARRTRGPLYPSPLWWHFPPNDQQKVFPELLESIGLVTTPNISSVPAWTQNASPDDAAEANKTENNMNKEKLIQLLGLSADATEQQIFQSIESKLQTANAAVDRTKLIGALKLEANATNDQIIEKVSGIFATANAAPDRKGLIALVGVSENASNDQISEAIRATNEKAGKVDGLTTANGNLVTALLNAFEKAGKITPAERPGWQAKFTANGADVVALSNELSGKESTMNTKHVEIEGTRIDVSTANARKSAVDQLVKKRMADTKCTYNEAFRQVQDDPKNRQLFEAMSDPTNKKAA